MFGLHRKEMTVAAERARQEYLESHPDLDLNKLDLDIGALVHASMYSVVTLLAKPTISSSVKWQKCINDDLLVKAYEACIFKIVSIAVKYLFQHNEQHKKQQQHHLHLLLH